jgi:hypothetical protein
MSTPARSIWMLGLTGFLALSAAAADEPAVLAGPEVMEATRTTSLVSRDYAGKVRTLARHEAIEALDLLTLSEDEKGLVGAVISGRAKELDGGGPKKIPILLDLQTGVQNNDVDKIDDALARLAATRPHFADETPLENTLGRQLSDSNAGELRRLVLEYQDAVVADGMMADASASREGILAAHRRKVLVAEVQASYERTAGQRQRDFQELSKRLKLTVEQEAQIQRIVLELATSNEYQPKGRDALKALYRGFGVLTWEQLRELGKIRRERTGSQGVVRDHPQKSAAFLSMPVLFVAGRRQRRRKV